MESASWICTWWNVFGALLESNLTTLHLGKNAFSQMNVKLAMQVLLAPVAAMIRREISATSAVLTSWNKGVYNLLAYLCKNTNSLVDIWNRRHGTHPLENTSKHQYKLLQIIEWFSQQKKLHNKRAVIEEAKRCNYVVHETWRCIQSLILAHVAIIQLYCVEKKWVNQLVGYQHWRCWVVLWRHEEHCRWHDKKGQHS